MNIVESLERATAVFETLAAIKGENHANLVSLIFRLELAYKNYMNMLAALMDEREDAAAVVESERQMLLSLLTETVGRLVNSLDESEVKEMKKNVDTLAQILTESRDA